MTSATVTVHRSNNEGTVGAALGAATLAHHRVVVMDLGVGETPDLPLVVVVAGGSDGHEVIPVSSVTTNDVRGTRWVALELARDASGEVSQEPPQGLDVEGTSDKPWYCWLFPQAPGCP